MRHVHETCDVKDLGTSTSWPSVAQMSRMYTIPLYEDLCTGTLKSFALEIFYQTQNQLHPNLRKTIQQILSQGLNPLPAIDTTAVTTDTPAMVLEDKVSEATNGAISLRDVNVSA